LFSFLRRNYYENGEKRCENDGGWLLSFGSMKLLNSVHLGIKIISRRSVAFLPLQRVIAGVHVLIMQGKKKNKVRLYARPTIVSSTASAPVRTLLTPNTGILLINYCVRTLNSFLCAVYLVR